MVANPIAGYGGPVTLTDGATITADCTQGSQFVVTLGGTGRTFTFSNPIPGQIVTLRVVQDATGSRTVTTWTNILWAGGTAVTLTTTAAATDILRFTYDAGSAKWYAETVGKAMA